MLPAKAIITSIPIVSMQSLPRFLTKDMELRVSSKAVLKTRTLTNGRVEALIKWEQLSMDSNTGEDY